MGIKDYSTTPADNDAPPPNGWPEGMAPSDVNNSARQMMADIRSWYQAAEWVDLGQTPTYATATTFTVVNDQTAFYTVGRRIRLTDATTLFGTISASSYSAPNTTVTVTLDSGTLSIALSAVAIGIVTSDSLPSVSSIQASTSAGALIKNQSGTTVATFGPGGGTGTAFAGNITVAGQSSGAAFISLAEDTDNGTNTATVQAPAALAADAVITLPDATGTLATLAGTETLTNKTLTTPVITGVTDGSNAAAGEVGEVIESEILTGSAVALTSGATANITSISLTAGDWDVSGVICINNGSAGVYSFVRGAVSDTSATLPALPSKGAGFAHQLGGGVGYGNVSASAFPIGHRRVSISSTTTYYLVANVNTTSCTGFGFIYARRAR